MAKYKVLQSVIHNAAHSLMSDVHWVAGSFFHDHLYDAARRARVRDVEIDLLAGTVFPPSVRTPEVAAGVEHEPRTFARLVTTGGADLTQVRRARVAIRFDFARSPDHDAGPGERKFYYACEAELEDDRGRVHRATVPEFWRC